MKLDLDKREHRSPLAWAMSPSKKHSEQVHQQYSRVERARQDFFSDFFVRHIGRVETMDLPLNLKFWL